MLGNVWEWCQDWHGGYPAGAVADPTGPGTGQCRVIRGGGWGYNAMCCRPACRSAYKPGDRYNYLGLRLAFSPPPDQR